MSTVDPASFRRTGPAAGPSIVGTAVGLLLCGGLWFVFGYALANLARYPIGTLYLTPDQQPANSTPSLLWAFFLAVFAGFIVNTGLISSLGRTVGIGASTRISLGVCLLAIGAGIQLGAPASWVRPELIGEFAGGGSWGPTAWLGWTSQYWAPVGLALWSFFLLIRAALGIRRRRQRDARVRAVIATGTKVDAIVTETTDTGVEVLNRPRIIFTVKFSDHLGVERWVTTAGSFDRTQIPRAGDRAVVWFDPANPGDQSSIPVSLDADGNPDSVLTDRGPVAL